MIELAAANPMAVPDFGPFKLYQLGMVVLTFIVFWAVWIYAQRRQMPPPREVPEQRWYFDGPVARALETLRDMLQVLKDIRRENDDYAKERNEQHKEHMKTFRELIDRMPRRR